MESGESTSAGIGKDLPLAIGSLLLPSHSGALGGTSEHLLYKGQPLIIPLLLLPLINLSQLKLTLITFVKHLAGAAQTQNSPSGRAILPWLPLLPFQLLASLIPPEAPGNLRWLTVRLLRPR